MKRNLILAALCLIFTLFLTSCGSDSKPSATTVPAASVSAEPSPSAELPDANLRPDTEIETVSDVLYEKAKSYEDKPLDELIAAVGEPLSSSYVSSCLGPGQDGELVYKTFTVITYQEGNSETVIYVEPKS